MKCRVLLFFSSLCLMLAVGALMAGGAVPDETALSQALKSARAMLEKEGAVDDETHKQLTALYNEATQWLDRAVRFRAKAEAYGRALREAPRQTEHIRKSLADQKTVATIQEVKRFQHRPLEELAQRVETRKADLLAAEARVNDLEQAPELLPERPSAARKRLVEAKQEAAALEQKLETAKEGATVLARATLMRDQAHLLALRREIHMLEQELLSLPVRQALRDARLAQARRRLVQIRGQVEALVALLNARRKAEAEKLSRTQEQERRSAVGSNPLLQAAAEENAALSRKLAHLTDELSQAATLDTSLRRQTKTIRDTYRATREKVEIAGLRGVLGQVLLEQRQQVPNLRRLRRRLDAIHRRITEASLEQIHLRESLEKLEAGEERPALPVGISQAQREKLLPELRRLRRQKRQLLEKLIATEEEYLRSLADQNLALQELTQAAKEFDDYLDEHLLWVRNTRALRLSDLHALSGELALLFKPLGWLPAWRALIRQVAADPLALLAFAALVLVTLLHGRWKKAIRELGVGAGKPGLGNLPHTLRALFMSFLLAFWPLGWLLFFYWRFRLLGDNMAIAHALAEALYWIMAPFYSLLLGRVLAMKGGLLQAHFRWREETLKKLRRAMAHLFWFFIPASAFTVIATHILPSGLGGVVVKLAFMVLALSLYFFIYRVFHPRRGVVATYLRQNPKGYAARLRWGWFAVGMGIPLVLLALSLTGYVYTAATILRYLMNSLWLIAALVVVQQLAEFWLLLSRRRIAYQAAMARRKAMEEAAEGGGAAGSPVDEEQVRPEEERVDLVTLSAESRRLLNALLFVAGAVGLWFIWSPLFPAFSVLDDIALWHHTVTVDGKATEVAVTLGDLLVVLSIVVLTVLATRNLPSLIEILLLQYLDVSSGGRYTIRTLSGYIIAGAGVVAVFNAVGGSWAQIQWLVAALGVGIGFGLQEIVANFVSGLIILLERPIRVGDFVTVGGTDGTVTRIRIRATTILTRDRKELLVPNKEFITGRLLNWTLSDQTTRVKLPVGVAYGTDLGLAEKIMLEAAREHPRVLKEPAPWINFTDFGDNALVLELRCIIDSAEYRVRVMSELRHIIERNFRAAGIEIPFPQRDVHLDAGEPLEITLKSSLPGGVAGQER